MKFLRSLVSPSIICTSILSSTSYAAALQLYELGTPIIGTAGVGQAALAQDASTSYFNPAAMSLLPNTEFMLGSQMVVPYVNFSKNAATTITGGNGGNAGSLIPGVDFYFAYEIMPELKLGLSVTTPYGGDLSYTDGWAGRYSVQDIIFYTINVNPSIGYRVTDWLSVGAGLAVEYINLQQTVALPIPLLPLVDGQAKISAANTAPGYNLGLMLMPYPSTKIGLAFRSQIVHHLHGDLTFLRITTTPNVTTRMVTPANLIMSVAQDVTENFVLLGELGWAHWSSMRNNIMTVDGFTVTVPQDWSDTYRLGLGAQFFVTKGLALQMGTSYDSSPTSPTKRLPVMPMDRQIRVGAGLMYHINMPVTLGISYEYINYGSAAINNTSANGVLAGNYQRNYANVFQLSLNSDI